MKALCQVVVQHETLLLVIHCGVVGNIQAFHVCAPGSIPGDGVFYFKGTGGQYNRTQNKNRMDTDHSSVGRAEDCSW